MSDATLRELERAAREGGDAAAWTRLALARARAGLDAGRAALQALLRDPAAPVRELLVAGVTPAPRALGRELPAISHTSGPLRAPIDAGLDLGGGRVALVAGDELLGVDLIDAAVVWRQRRPEVAMQTAPVRVGGQLAELSGAGALLLGWFDGRTGGDAHTLPLPDEVQPAQPEEAEYARTGLVALDATRCASVVEGPGDGWWACFHDLERGALLRTVRLASTTPPWPIEAGGALVTDADGALAAWEPDGTPRWSVRVGQEGLPLAGSRAHVVARVHADGAWAVALLGADDGRRRATLPRDWLAAMLAGDLVVGSTARPDEARALVEAWTQGGALRWARELPWPRGHGLDLHAAGDVLVVVRSERALAPHALETTALDLASGETLWTRAAPDDESLVLPAAGLLLAVGPTEGWFRRATPLRRLGPA